MKTEPALVPPGLVLAGASGRSRPAPPGPRRGRRREGELGPDHHLGWADRRAAVAEGQPLGTVLAPGRRRPGPASGSATRQAAVSDRGRRRSSAPRRPPIRDADRPLETASGRPRRCAGPAPAGRPPRRPAPPPARVGAAAPDLDAAQAGPEAHDQAAKPASATSRFEPLPDHQHRDRRARPGPGARPARSSSAGLDEQGGRAADPVGGEGAERVRRPRPGAPSRAASRLEPAAVGTGALTTPGRPAARRAAWSGRRPRACSTGRPAAAGRPPRPRSSSRPGA